MIELFSVRKDFAVGSQVVEALRGIDMTIQKGEIVSIVGPSGSGKSTLLGIMGGLDHPTSGRVTIDGVEISQMSERRLTHIRNQKIGFVFQFYNLLPALTALENIALPVYFSRDSREAPLKRAQELLSQLEISDRAEHQPAQLSGGQQQRIAIARALANHPPILLADEPTGNLNTEAGEMVLESIFELREQLGTTIVIVTHNASIAARTDRIMKLVDGVIVSETRGSR